LPGFQQMLDILSPALYALCAVHKNLHLHSCCSRGNYSLDRDSFLLRWDAVLLGLYFLTVQRMIMAPLSTAWLWRWKYYDPSSQRHSSAAHKKCTFSNVTAVPQISLHLDVFLQIFKYSTLPCVTIFFTMSHMQLLTKWVHYLLQWCVLLLCLHLCCTLQTIQIILSCFCSCHCYSINWT